MITLLWFPPFDGERDWVFSGGLEFAGPEIVEEEAKRGLLAGLLLAKLFVVSEELFWRGRLGLMAAILGLELLGEADTADEGETFPEAFKKALAAFRSISIFFSYSILRF